MPFISLPMHMKEELLSRINEVKNILDKMKKGEKRIVDQ